MPSADSRSADSRFANLAERMRPRSLDEVVGQEHLLAVGAPLRVALETGRVPSLVFWGPPGVGKTTLARLFAQHTAANFLSLSAVMAGVKDIRDAVATARREKEGIAPRATVLFIDEIHRFNKAQQDALLPFVEDGTLTLIGATTENPSFELNGALLSRLRVFVLRSLEEGDVRELLRRAIVDPVRGMGQPVDAIPQAWLDRIAESADGDARRALILLETAFELGRAAGGNDDELLEKLIGKGLRRFDKKGDNFYDQISALHKSVRGSDPDGALYWFARMLDGGVDGAYVARRVTRMAVEDIGLADPRALQVALNAWDAYERLGSPEGDLALAEAVLYMAVAAKSNSAYVALDAAKQAVVQHGSQAVPLHLRNAPTRLMKELDYGKGYRYDHGESDAHAAGQRYLPDVLAGKEFYSPSPRGLEGKIAEKLAQLRAANRSEGRRRPDG